MGFNSAFKGLSTLTLFGTLFYVTVVTVTHIFFFPFVFAVSDYL